MKLVGESGVSGLPVLARDQRPRDWEKAVLVAWCRFWNMSQRDAAITAKVCERTVRYWEASAWWPDALVEAMKSDHFAVAAVSLATRNYMAALAAGDLAVSAQVLSRIGPLAGDNGSRLTPEERRKLDLHDALESLTKEELEMVKSGGPEEIASIPRIARFIVDETDT